MGIKDEESEGIMTHRYIATHWQPRNRRMTWRERALEWARFWGPVIGIMLGASLTFYVWVNRVTPNNYKIKTQGEQHVRTK